MLAQDLRSNAHRTTSSEVQLHSKFPAAFGNRYNIAEDEEEEFALLDDASPDPKYGGSSSEAPERRHLGSKRSRYLQVGPLGVAMSILHRPFLGRLSVCLPSAGQHLEVVTSSLIKVLSHVQEARVQVGMVSQLACGLGLNSLVSLITLAFIGRHYSVNALAAAALANSFYSSFARMPLVGLAGALDTKASQASTPKYKLESQSKESLTMLCTTSLKSVQPCLAAWLHLLTI